MIASAASKLSTFAKRPSSIPPILLSNSLSNPFSSKRPLLSLVVSSSAASSCCCALSSLCFWIAIAAACVAAASSCALAVAKSVAVVFLAAETLGAVLPPSSLSALVLAAFNARIAHMEY